MTWFHKPDLTYIGSGYIFWMIFSSGAANDMAGTGEPF